MTISNTLRMLAIVVLAAATATASAFEPSVSFSTGYDELAVVERHDRLIADWNEGNEWQTVKWPATRSQWDLSFSTDGIVFKKKASSYSTAKAMFQGRGLGDGTSIAIAPKYATERLDTGSWWDGSAKQRTETGIGSTLTTHPKGVFTDRYHRVDLKPHLGPMSILQTQGTPANVAERVNSWTEWNIDQQDSWLLDHYKSNLLFADLKPHL